MDKARYEQYVKTDCWGLRKRDYLRKHRIEWCEACGQKRELQVHHLTYAHLGEELDEDLLAVCEGCHRLFHGLAGATPRAWVNQYLESAPGIKARKVFAALERPE